MDNRKELGKIYQEHYQTGIGAEIGVLYGIFTNQILENWEGSIMAVDVWNNKYQFIRAIDQLTDTRTILVKGSSRNVSKLIANDSLDWVYIDSDHSYNGVKEDIEGWFPKVRKGGIISGHDYIKASDMDPEVLERYGFVKGQGVCKAVDEFCEKNGYKVELFHETEMLIDKEVVWVPDWASWWFEKV